MKITATPPPPPPKKPNLRGHTNIAAVYLEFSGFNYSEQTDDLSVNRSKRSRADPSVSTGGTVRQEMFECRQKTFT